MNNQLESYDAEAMTIDEFRTEVMETLCCGMGIKELHRLMGEIPCGDDLYGMGRLDDLFTLYGVVGLDHADVANALDTLVDLYHVLHDILHGGRPSLGAKSSL